jgi:hypothetical protein
MKEPYVEGLANYSGHESCAGSRKETRKAFDSGMYRLGIEPRKTNSECRHGAGRWKAIFETSLMRDVERLCVVEDPIHVQKLYARESGYPVVGLEHIMIQVRIENPKGVQQ